MPADFLSFPSRRLCLRYLGQAVLTSTIFSPMCKGVADAESSDWLDACIARMKGGSEDRAPEGALWFSRFKDPMYFLLQPITWKPNPGQDDFAPVTVPRGFVTDLASIPQVFWSLLRPDGDYAYAAIVHDYLYWTQTRTRAESDHIFKFAMEDFQIKSITVKAIYDAVSGGGQRAWNENRQLRERGEKRILKQFPQDPRTSWAEWKRRPDVFA